MRRGCGDACTKNAEGLIVNAENQITQMDGGAAVYGYDGEGRRMKKIVGSETTYYFYGPMGLLCEFTTTNTGTTAAASTDRTTYKTSDKLGTAVLILNASGTVIENNRTLPYGEAWLPEVTSTNDKKFTTYQRDAESGLDYADARHYQSTQGRFISTDRGGTRLEIPQGWNKYTYVLNDPVNLTDPKGLFPCTVGAGEGEETVQCELVHIPRPRPPMTVREWDDLHEHNIISTFGQAQGTFIHVGNPSKSGANQNRITDVMRWIQGHIDSNCSNWLSGVSGAIDSLLGDPSDPRTVLIGHGEFGRGVAAFTGNNTSQTDLPEGYAMTINDLGGFFVGQYTAGTARFNITVGNYRGGTSQAQAEILLHELAHFVNAAGFQADFNNAAAGRANERLVQQNCGSTLNAARNIP